MGLYFYTYRVLLSLTLLPIEKYYWTSEPDKYRANFSHATSVPTPPHRGAAPMACWR